MSKADRIVISILGVISVSFGITALTGIWRQHQEDMAEMQKQSLPVAPQSVIGSNTDFKGALNAPYTLVEFGDYQCPPCRAANPEITSLLQANPTRLRFTFRNFPLTKIHPYAMQAAITAETAREFNSFWLVHDDLYDGPVGQFNESSIRNAILASRLDYNVSTAVSLAARARILNDLSEAKTLGLRGTPSFLLCTPDGKVVLLQSLDQLQYFLQ